MAPRVHGRWQGPRIQVRQFRIPRRDLELVLFRRRPVDEEPEVVVHLSRGHFGRIENYLRSRLGEPEAQKSPDFLANPPPGFPPIRAEIQGGAGDCPPPSM